MRVLSTGLSSHVGERVTLAGWLHAKRELGSVSFVLVRDRAGLAQTVVDPSNNSLQGRDALELAAETVVEVDGDVVAAPQAPGGVELHEPSFRVLGEPEGPPPIELRRPVLKETLPTILDHAPVALRHPRERAKFQLAAASLAGFRAALDDLGFTEISTPKIVASATESGANLFALDYFGLPAFLAQSPQFYKQTTVGIFERVYEVGPVFRAEPHETGRHLAEYTSLDAEFGFIRDHFDVMAVVREALEGMVDAVRRRAAEALELLQVELPEVPTEIPWVHFADTGVDDVDLAPADERRLCGEHGEWLFVTGFPMAKRPFYTHPAPGCPQYSNSFDLLFRGMEIVTGGQRLHRYEDYVAALGGATEPYEGYLEAFVTGCRRTAASRSGWSAGWRGSSGYATSERRRSFRETEIASRRERDQAGVVEALPPDRLDEVRGRLRVQRERHQRLVSATRARDGHVGDVHAGLPEERPDPADHTRDVVVAEEDHQRRELHLELEPQRADQPVPVVVADRRAGDANFVAVRADLDADEVGEVP
jgi:nondiscriminating aspartyl-tRNA synthetase